MHTKRREGGAAHGRKEGRVCGRRGATHSMSPGRSSTTSGTAALKRGWARRLRASLSVTALKRVPYSCIVLQLRLG